MFRIGIGYDSHRLVEYRKLVIGGVHIDYERGLLGHSDGDVALHAIADALLGAIGAGDIGIYFPDTDVRFKNIDSSIMIKEVLAKVVTAGYTIVNVDLVIIAEDPKLKSYYEMIKETISTILNIAKEQVNVKAKTNEKMGAIGHGEGIACISVVLLESL
jgi:2-C-methyl-D-erythritol 2,4-cyclodiphosphate synthase